jgi:two-component system chemotaxis response regulator CheB
MRHLSQQGEDVSRAARRPTGTRATPAVVAIASSTGGPPALKALLAALPANFPWPVLIAQHLTPGFEDGLSRWLGQHCALPVRVVTKAMPLGPGVFIGQPEHDLVVHARDEVRVVPAPARGYHPSGDRLFETAVTAFGAQVVAVVMSGIGSDGLRGATAVQGAGGLVLAQAMAPVRGMPDAVTKAGLAAGEGSPEQLGARLSALAQGRSGREG